jgi:Protein of unknown function (DUF3224)
MKMPRAQGNIIAMLCMCLGFSFSELAHSSMPVAQKETAMAAHASGTFDVKVTPEGPGNNPEASLSRMSLDKQFHGDLEATSKGQMLGAGTSVKGSAGYVAMERVTGKLRGKAGSFTLQHSGTMTRGALQLSVTVVPDSGTSELEGLTGKMTINIADGKHSYEFDYTLPTK